MSDPKRVFLIDAMSHIFRAFFAPMRSRQEPMRNSAGQPTQAVFVFTSMLRKLITDEKPDYIAAVFDTPEPTFRHEDYPEYKANREEMPEDLAVQIPYIVRVCEALNVPVLKMPGFEADDIIGTFAKKLEEHELTTVIVSNDKDLCQLVKDPYVLCMRQNSQNIRRKVPVPPVEWCDEAWVKKKFQLPPEKIIDYLGLMGDSVDNIPGAPGIGAKGALKLIQEYGSAEGAMENADKVSHKTYRESLQQNQEIIRKSVELATVHEEVPIELDLKQLTMREPKRQKAYEVFRELEFNSLTREFADAAPLFSADSDGAGPARDYLLVSTLAELEKIIRRLWEAETFSFELETSDTPGNSGSFQTLPPTGVAFSTSKGRSFYIDLTGFGENTEAALTIIRDTLENKYLKKNTHDLKRILAALRHLETDPVRVINDSMVAAYVVDSGSRKYDVRSLAEHNLKEEIRTEIPSGWKESQYRTAERADFINQLAFHLGPRLKADELGTVYDEIEMPLIPVLYEMEMAGMKVDSEALKECSATLAGELEKIGRRAYAIAGREFNMNSPKQVAEILQDLNIETKYRTPTGKISTSKDALQEIAENYEIAEHIIRYREIDKLKSTYADSLQLMVSADGRIHGTLNQTVAATGRLSSTEPNLQNIPIRTELGREIRRAFVAEDGCVLISADYSQLELRILAHITQDRVMLQAFSDGEDIHAKTARLVFGAETDSELKEKRRLAKIVNFGIAYAVEPFGLAQRVGISRKEAKKVIEDYYETYSGVKKYMDETPEKARRDGFVTSLFGRRRYFPSIRDRNFAVRSRAEREAINMPMQGTASDIVKLAMINVRRAFRNEGLRSKLLMQVHDELLVEAPDDEADAVRTILTAEMESATVLDVPLEVEIGSGENWMEVK